MNKRQAKKNSKKFVYGLVDEWNLIAMDAEEQKVARKEFEDYCRKYRHFKHYRDRKKIWMKPCMYQYPISKAQREFTDQIMRTTRSYRVTPIIVFQSLSDLRDRYGNELFYD